MKVESGKKYNMNEIKPMYELLHCFLEQSPYFIYVKGYVRYKINKDRGVYGNIVKMVRSITYSC